jgi:spermidine synthase
MASYLIVAFTSSFCSMSFSMIMALIMGEFTGEEVLTQCLTLGPYLLGLGIGSASGDKISEKVRLPRLFIIEWFSVMFLPLIPLLQLLGIFLFINLAPTSYNFESKEAVIILLSVTGTLSLISGLLGGAQLPLILKAAAGVRAEVVLAINYLGPLFAGLTIVFLSGQAMSFGVQIYFIGLIQLVGLFVLLFRLPERTKAMASLMIPLAILFAAGLGYPHLETYTVKSGYMNTRVNGWKDLVDPRPLLRVLNRYGLLQRVRTSYQTIDLFIEPGDPALGVPGNATLYLNRKPQFDYFSVDVYHQTMIDGAFNLLNKTPERILILGAGDGLLLNELRKFPDVKEIIMVELDSKILEWSAESIIVSKLNEGVLNNIPSNAQILIQDGVSYLRNNKKPFDLILVDFPFPNGQELAKLYSREFYELVRKSLKPSGLTVVDLPLYLNEEGDLSNESRTILKTMNAAGFDNRLLMGPNASFIAMKRGGGKLKFNYDTFRKDLALSAALNLVAPFNVQEFNKEDKINTMFWPRGL